MNAVSPRPRADRAQISGRSWKRPHIAIVTDAWAPQVNGVVTTLRAVAVELERLGYEVSVIHPGLFASRPLPAYPEIRVALNPAGLRHSLKSLRPDSIHIATEGPLGLFARLWLARHGLPFTTSLHTKFPEYLNERRGVPLRWTRGLMRWFHNGSATTLCSSYGHAQELKAQGFDRLRVWGPGVNTRLFTPQTEPRCRARPAELLYVGRVAREKNLSAFLELSTQGERCTVVGDGPSRSALQARYPRARWLGYQHGAALAAAYQAADVLVFPSRTDTFGLVMLEAMACGTPVAAYPVTGPIDAVLPGRSGALHQDLRVAVKEALALDRQGVASYAAQFSWRKIAQRLLEVQQTIAWPDGGPAWPISIELGLWPAG